MEAQPAPTFSVGYGNGYGYPSELAPTTQATQATQAIPAMQVTTTMPALPADLRPVDATPAAAPAVEADRRWIVRSALAAAVIVALLAGALAMGAHRSSVELGSSSTRGHAGPTSASDAFQLGGSIPDAPGAPIVLDPPDATPTTATPATAAPTTAPPTTTAPTVPPSTTPPSTTPPSTTPPVVVNPTLPPLHLLPSITSFTTPASGGCIAPFNFPQMINVSWNTKFATKVTLSIDGPGIYRSYDGPSGSDTLPFACPGSHTYLLTAYNASGDHVSQQVIING
jgi:hypothetical protein